MNGPSPASRKLSAVGHALIYLGVFLGSQFIVSTMYTSAFAAQLMMQPNMDYETLYFTVYDLVMEKTLEISLLSGLLTLLILFVSFVLRRKKPLQEVLIAPTTGGMVIRCAVLAFCLYWAVTLVLALVPEAMMAGYIEASQGIYQTDLVAFFATVLVAPVVEEIVFRGLIYSRLCRAMDSKNAVIISACIFGLCHGQFIWFLYAFVLGMILGWITRETASILPAIVMHVVFNGTNEILILLENVLPEVVLWIFVLVFGIPGTILAFLWVRRRVSAENTVAATEEEGTEIPPLPAEESPVQHRRSAPAVWDSDSGPNHRFPPNRL